MSWMTFVGDKDVGNGFWRVGDSFVMFMTDVGDQFFTLKNNLQVFNDSVTNILKCHLHKSSK